jgi:hypothetical protein
LETKSVFSYAFQSDFFVVPFDILLKNLFATPMKKTKLW